MSKNKTFISLSVSFKLLIVDRILLLIYYILNHFIETKYEKNNCLLSNIVHRVEKSYL